MTSKTSTRPRRPRLLLKILLVFLALIVLYWASVFARVVWWNYVNPSQTAFMAERLATLRSKNPRAQLKYRWVDYNKISMQLKRAVVAAEDDRFTEHSGFDWQSISQALEKNLEKGKTVAGGSTISQQLAKNLFLSSEKSITRKAREAIITVMIETVWSKQRILEVYLNIAEWGDGVFGAEAAARHYYHCSAAQLNSWQAARLAVMLPNPRRFERRYPAYLERHAIRVRERMHRSVVP